MIARGLTGVFSHFCSSVLMYAGSSDYFVFNSKGVDFKNGGLVKQYDSTHTRQLRQAYFAVLQNFETFEQAPSNVPVSTASGQSKSPSQIEVTTKACYCSLLYTIATTRITSHVACDMRHLSHTYTQHTHMLLTLSSHIQGTLRSSRSHSSPTHSPRIEPGSPDCTVQDCQSRQCSPAYDIQHGSPDYTGNDCPSPAFSPAHDIQYGSPEEAARCPSNIPDQNQGLSTLSADAAQGPVITHDPMDWLRKYPKAHELLAKCYYWDFKKKFYDTSYFKQGVPKDDQAQARKAVDRYRQWKKPKKGK
jgi:hypothetical protein